MFFFWPFFWIGGMGFLAVLWNILGIAFLFAFFYSLFRYGFGIHRRRRWKRWGKYYGSHERNTPCEILRRRYAAGEISKEEYEKIKEDLGCG